MEPITPSQLSSSPSGSTLQSQLRTPRDGKAPKREQVAAACLQCRSKKVKVGWTAHGVRAALILPSQCDAIRPSCGRCRQRRLQCEYDVADEGTTKLEDSKRRNEEVQEQLERMRELYGYLAERPYTEATQILNLIRARPDDPLAVLRAIQEADLLLRRAAGPQP